MRRAQHLLESTDRTTRQIHLEVGYRDHGTFAALFTRHFGVRPTDYRAGLRRGTSLSVITRQSPSLGRNGYGGLDQWKGR
ncbi:helix-turn-helix domain-containing protein [Streptomyces sp. NBC_01716]|uniref:helix-turn-helix domain-containing protein n=1 Tax=Streptomyces sp. NBC_01716 TaxID=2975917 RepID=UPI002E344FF1|nr:helix-turn-helix domain-containing protein [Streptomyces sp. NBC_01716]